MDGDDWASVANRFVDDHYGSLRGRVRTHVVDRCLREHLPPPPARVVDIGAGAGHQSIPLARDGYDVTLVDPSEAMLTRAKELLGSERPEVSSRVQLVKATGEDAPSIVDGRFDGVLCHGVTMYLPEPGPLLQALADLATMGGIVSIVAKNQSNLAVRPALEGRWSDALASFDSRQQVNGLGLDTRGDSIEGLTGEMASLGVAQVAWYGVRLFTDGWTAEQGTADQEDVVLAVELEASRRDPYRLMSRLFHFVGVRR